MSDNTKKKGKHHNELEDILLRKLAFQFKAIANLEGEKNVIKGKKGFQEVKEKRSNNVMVRFTDKEYKTIEEVLGDAPKASIIREVFLEYVTTLKDKVRQTS
jgi:hypothetical protein